MIDPLLDRPYQGYAYAYPHKSAYRTLDPRRSLSEVWSRQDQHSLFLYLHIPFCEFRCGFCNLFTHAQPAEGLVPAYLSALQQQALAWNDAVPRAQFSRLALGGGTPTYLSIEELERLFEILHGTLSLDPRLVPTSCEASPATIDSAKLRWLRAAGVDRLSLGVQSFDRQETGALGRPQKPLDVERALAAIADADFPIMNLDLIYGGQGQTIESWLASVRVAASYQPEELYLYPLYVRPLTGLGRLESDKSELTDHDDPPWDKFRLHAYRTARDWLLSEGYEQVSMRMFRRSDSRLLDGPVYCCQNDGMVGLGCGARSYTRDLHYSYEYAVGNTAVMAIIQHFIAKSRVDFGHIEFGHQLTFEDQMRRFVIQGVLQADGLELSLFHARFNRDLLEALPQLHQLLDSDLATLDDERFILTSSGLERSDAIGPWLYSQHVAMLMETYECQ